MSLFSFITFVNIYLSINYISDMLAIYAGGSAFVINFMINRLVIYAVILPLLYKFVRPRFRRLVGALDKEWRAAGLVPMMFLIMQIMVLYYPSPYWSWNNEIWYKSIIITVYMLFLAVYYLLYIQANAIVEKYALEKRQLLMAQQEKLWESELARQKAAVALAFQQRHDMRHHNAVIIDMLKNGNVAELEDYMKSFNEALDMSKTTAYCKNPIVNSICNAYSLKAERARIKIYFHMAVPEQAGIDNVDLTCIFGNALENSIEGCLRLPKDCEKEIIVTAKYLDGRLRIQVENSCSEEIVFDGELPKTQKQGGGTGIHSIIYTTEKYDGTYRFSVGNGKFTTQIVLNAHEVIPKSETQEATVS
ncbi:MAG: ATP-binding protein [Anaerotignum sp.]|nr:ATP-binding protein [Anaerotignum sp.]